MKAGFVNIFGRPNAGKSTLLNALVGEKLAIVSPKVQTTRHRIKGILSGDDYQVVFSDTPGIIEPRYRLQEKMMKAVHTAAKDADLALLMVDINDDWKKCDEIFLALRLRIPALLVINKSDMASKKKAEQAVQFFGSRPYCREVILFSALGGAGKEKLLAAILRYLPEGEPFYETDELTDLNTRFFIAEFIREKIFELYEQEIPYQSTVVIREYKDTATLVKIVADIIVQRESQKAIILGQGGRMIKELGTASRKSIEEFLQRKTFLELFVKVRDKWRDRDLYLKEYGYH